MARRKRNRTLGGARADHAAVGHEALEKVIPRTEAAIAAAERGDCVTALGYRDVANQALYRARVELFNYGNMSRSKGFSDAHEAVMRAGRVFRKRCLR